MIDLEKVKKSASLREREMDVPVLGGTARVRLFRKADLDGMRAESMVAGEIDNEKFERLLVMRGLIEPAIDDATYDELKNGNAAVYYALVKVVMEGNGMTELAARDARRTFPS